MRSTALSVVLVLTTCVVQTGIFEAARAAGPGVQERGVDQCNDGVDHHDPAGRGCAQRLGDLVTRLFNEMRDGDLDATFEIATRYETGVGVPKNPLFALQLYERGARAGHALAQHHFGLRILNFAHRDDQRWHGLYWLGSAASQGHGLSALILGHIHENGLYGLTRDGCAARQWYDASQILGQTEGHSFMAALDRQGSCG